MSPTVKGQRNGEDAIFNSHEIFSCLTGSNRQEKLSSILEFLTPLSE